MDDQLPGHVPAGHTSPTRWEQAYQAFETPEEERRKFITRLRNIGADKWDRHGQVVEVCSGRGSGLQAWQALGFTRLLGVDYSPALIARQRGGLRIIGDARRLPLASRSVDVAVVQGGLHHLFTTSDVGQAVAEMCRVLRPGGKIVIIEPWLTPFLRLVHAICRQPAARRLSSRVDALSTMIEEERETYERWLNAPDEHLEVILRHVRPNMIQRRWGKLIVVGEPAES
jgi:ubiquinone/menaquinone biosynthesis C-methylase UbiE